MLKDYRLLSEVAMKNISYAILACSTIFLLEGCAHKESSDGSLTEIEKEYQETSLTDALDSDSQPAAKNPPTTLPEAQTAKAGRAKGSISESPALVSADADEVEKVSNEIDNISQPTAEPNKEKYLVESEAPPFPTIPSIKLKSKKVEKPIRKTVKFKLPKKSSAQVLFTETSKNVKIDFSATRIKKGKYWLFLEKSCKRAAKSKPIKIAQFEVKKGDKFSGKSQTNAVSFKGRTPSSLSGKGLVLYVGPKANTRLSCQTIK